MRNKTPIIFWFALSAVVVAVLCMAAHAQTNTIQVITNGNGVPVSIGGQPVFAMIQPERTLPKSFLILERRSRLKQFRLCC